MRHPKARGGQPFTFRPLNERRLLSAETDQALSSQKCQNKTFPSQVCATAPQVSACRSVDESYCCFSQSLDELSSPS
jgi:hypothetical protein